MSTYYVSSALHEQLRAADDHRCAYCHTSQANTGQPMVVEHIIPRKLGGETVFENLCYACRRCNEFKGARITQQDPLSGIKVTLFNPRTAVWREHFAWDASGIYLMGLTDVGRATIVALNMNL